MFVINKMNHVQRFNSATPGTHLSAYFSHTEDDSKRSLELEIRSLLRKSQKLLEKEHTQDFIRKFLEPLKRLSQETPLISKNHSNGWALFRSMNSFILEKVPFNVKKLHVISQSFHIKPMLKLNQFKKESYVLVINNNQADLLKSKNGSLEFVSLFNFDQVNLDFDHLTKELDHWVNEFIQDSSKPLILAGNLKLINTFLSASRYPFILSQFIPGKFNLLNYTTRLRRHVNKLLDKFKNKEQKSVLKKIKHAKLNNKLELNLLKVAKSVINNEIKRLYIAEEVHVWGVIDHQSGALQINPHHQDCQDDDILDDLAEIALKNKAEVVLLSQKYLPENASIAAIKK